MARLAFLVVLTSLVLVGCPSDPGPPPPADTGPRTDAPRLDGAADDDGGTVDDGGGSTTDDGGGSTDDGGGTTDDGGGTTDVDAGGTTDVDAGGTTDVDAGGTTDVDAGGTIDVDAGGSTTADAGPGRVDSGAGGRTCSSNADCPVVGAFCDKGSANCAGTGTCMAMPRFCPDVIDPVCGCDGVTYDNACFAHADGINIASGGACAGACMLRPRASCCFADDDCARGESCTGERCSSGGEGTCHAAPRTGECWEDSDCPRGVTCVGENVCACGVLCFAPDSPGTCGAIILP